MYRVSLSGLLVLFVLSGFAMAQHGGHAGSAAPPSFARPIGSPARGVHGFGQFHSQRPFRNNPLLLGAPFLYDYADYSGEPFGYEVEPPPVAMVPPPRPVVPEPPPAEPLLLEWHGDRWVRIDPNSATSIPPAPTKATTVPSAPPSAVLVFADGHQEEVSRYMIVGTTMYANTDYWTTGAWTKKILLSSLDLPASLRANQERGSKLLLPAGPNEVVIGP
ncbi:MAG TPA: hypothetical protein VJQ82_03310 [Terriglobales bacterium]|nr:hypothetical protein [Terriglobales bacterium]